MSDAFKKKRTFKSVQRKKKTHLGVIFMALFGSLRNHKSRNNDFSLYPPEKNISKDRDVHMYYSCAQDVRISRAAGSVLAGRGQTL